MRNFVALCLVCWLATASSVSGQLTSCRVPTFCKRNDGDTATVWTDLQGNIIDGAQPPPPPVTTTATTTTTTTEAPPPPPPPQPDVLDPSLTDNEQIAALLVRISELTAAGWYNGGSGYQYWVSPKGTYVTYSAAKLMCAEKNSNVAYVGPRDAALRKTIIDAILRRNGDAHAFWIDLTDVVTENTFLWADGVVARDEDTDWNQGQPDNWNGADCTVISRNMNYRFDDVPCETSTNAVLCEKFIGQSIP